MTVCLPHSVDDGSVSVESNHFINFGDVVQKGVFVVGEERVRNPDHLGKVSC